MRNNILIVSGSSRVRDSLAERLRSKGFAVTLAEGADEALDVVRRVSVDTVFIEVSRGEVRAKRIRSRILRERPDCRVVLAANFQEVHNSAELLRFGNDDFLLPTDVLLDLLVSEDDGRLDRVKQAMIERETQSLIHVIDVLVGLVELGQKHFAGSSHRTMRLARAIAEEMGIDEETIRELVIATLLRDIGRAGIEADVLAQEDELSPEQMEVVREHVDASVRLLEHIDFPWKVLLVIQHHHERYDGKGYPDGLKGREIPIGARILAAADAFAAMTSTRPHRKPVPPEDALEEMERHAGVQFDPEVIEVLLRVAGKNRSRSASLTNPLVLLVDSDAEFRQLLKMKLLNQGFEVQAVKSVSAAGKRISASPPDLVLASLGADKESVLGLLRETREEPSTSQLPFVVLADSNNRVLRVRALRQRADDFLEKAGDLEELVVRIDNILTRESLRRAGDSTRRRSGITGQIESLPLPDIVQTLSIGMKTACVSLASEGSMGKIWFRFGKLVHAECGLCEGEEAVFEMLGWKEGEFVIRHGVKTDKTTIEKDAMYLMLEGLRQIDEGHGGEDALDDQGDQVAAAT